MFCILLILWRGSDRKRIAYLTDLVLCQDLAQIKMGVVLVLRLLQIIRS